MPYIARPSSGGTLTRRKGRRKTRPISTITKSIGYSATVNDTLLEITKSTSATESSSADISHVTVTNTGSVPALAVFAYNRWTDEDTVGAVSYLHFLLSAGENVSLPAQRAIMTDDSDMYEGDVVTATAPNSNEYTDSGDNVASGELNNTTDPVVFELDNGHEQYRVGDLIRCENEILRVEGTYDDNPTASTVADNHIVVSRGWNGSTNAAHSGTPDVYYAFFNDYHDFDTYTLSQTDNLGRWKSSNFFGYGRAASGEGGLMAGSVAIQFYTQGKAIFNLSDLTYNTESGLTASTAYEFDITVDGGTTYDNLSFTTDSSNTKFGGSTGIIAKIQAALDTQYYTAGNLFEKKVTVDIEDGDLVFRSGSYLAGSAIAIGAGSSGTDEFLGTGRIPSAATSIDARLETETTTNPITNSTTYKQIFIRDDGRGNLIWKNERKVGTVNYETGAIEWTIAERPNAEFVVSVLHTSAMSGKLATSTSGNNVRINSLRQVLGNTPQQKCEAVLTVETF